MNTKSLTITEAARLLGITRQGVRAMVLRGDLKIVARVGDRGVYLLDGEQVRQLVNVRSK